MGRTQPFGVIRCSSKNVLGKIAEARVSGPSGSRVALPGLLFPSELAKLITHVLIQCTHLGHLPQTTSDIGNTFLSLYDTAFTWLCITV